MAKLKEGDSVIVAAREQTGADVKSGLYYPHYANLTGCILKLYGEEASVTVNRESLPQEQARRHEDNEKAMRQRWLDGLSEEGRNRLSPAEKAFKLNYTILVSLSDLSPHKGATPAPPRPTSADLDAAEAEFLARRAAASQAVE